MIIIINIILCLLNAVMAYSHYKKEKYRSAIFAAFAAGMTAMGAIAIALINFG